jgi:hypothetical protein
MNVFFITFVHICCCVINPQMHNKVDNFIKQNGIKITDNNKRSKYDTRDTKNT